MQIRLHELTSVVREGGIMATMNRGLVQVQAGFRHTLCFPIQCDDELAEGSTRKVAEALNFRTEPMQDQRIEASDRGVDYLQV